MNLLLDTHTLLWWLSDDKNLSGKVRSAIQKPTNHVFVSSVSAWEISIKRAVKKLKAPSDLEEAVRDSHFEMLPILFSHARLAGELPFHHQDPFDRMLVAQAKVEKLVLVSEDTMIRKYSVQTFPDH